MLQLNNFFLKKYDHFFKIYLKLKKVEKHFDNGEKFVS